jgi:hypothetical protein
VHTPTKHSPAMQQGHAALTMKPPCLPLTKKPSFIHLTKKPCRALRYRTGRLARASRVCRHTMCPLWGDRALAPSCSGMSACRACRTTCQLSPRPTLSMANRIATDAAINKSRSLHLVASCCQWLRTASHMFCRLLSAPTPDLCCTALTKRNFSCNGYPKHLKGGVPGTPYISGSAAAKNNADPAVFPTSASFSSPTPASGSNDAASLKSLFRVASKTVRGNTEAGNAFNACTNLNKRSAAVVSVAAGWWCQTT